VPGGLPERPQTSPLGRSLLVWDAGIPEARCTLLLSLIMSDSS
jgi:hypothetical protein